MICFAPGLGGAYVFLSLPATASRQLLVPAALALAFESVRSPSRRTRRLDGRCGSRARRRPSDLRDLPLDPVRRASSRTRALWERNDLRNGTLALVALVVPAALFLLWLRPIVERHALGLARRGRASARIRAVPGPARRPLRHLVQPRARGVHASGCGRDRGAAPHSAGRVCGAAAVGGVRRRRVARGLRRDVAAASSSRRSPISSRSRRRAEQRGSFLSRSRSPVASACSPGSSGRCSLPLALGAGMFLQIVYPGDFDYVLKDPAPAWIAWFAVIGAVVALVVGLMRRRPALETGAALAAAAFLIPVVGGGLLDWRPPPPPAIATLSSGLVDAVRRRRWSRGRSSSPIPRRAFGSRRSRPSTSRLGAAGPCRGHGEEPAVRARARGSSIPPNRRPLDPATGTAPST